MENSNLNFNEFRRINKSEWERVATKELKGDSPDDRLDWSSEFGMPLYAYYDSSDRKELNYLYDFSCNISPHKWKLLAPIEVSNEVDANNQALEALDGGCDGILFLIGEKFDLKRLTKDILFEHCDVSFLVSNECVDYIQTYRHSQNIHGFVIEKNGGFSSWYSDQFAQSSGLDNLTDMVIDFAKEPCKNPTIFLRLGQDFFHEMARVRAVRYLFWRVAEVVKEPLNPNDISIHCEPRGVEKMDENIFTQSAAGLAAIIGGAKSISFDSSNGNPRISRNVGNLLRDESKISTFMNAGSGSFYIDSLTHQMIRHVWEKLQERLDA